MKNKKDKKNEKNKNKEKDKNLNIFKIKNISKKKLIITVLLILILIVVVVFLIKKNYDNKNDEMNDLSIHYSDGKINKFTDFNSKFTYSKVITIKNESNENKTYSLEWTKVSNKLKAQDKFTYEIKCTGDRCAELGKSQVPITGSLVYPQVVIEGGKVQEYEIIFSYDGSEKDVFFSGMLKVYSEKIDQNKVEKEIDKHTGV